MAKKMSRSLGVYSDDQLNDVLSPLVGKSCCLQKTGSMRDLVIGFGKKIPHTQQKLVGAHYGEWEIRTYLASWRIVANGRILCGSRDLGDSIAELNESLQRITFGKFVRLATMSAFDVNMQFDNGLLIEFFGTAGNYDETLEIIGPNEFQATYCSNIGWKVG